MRTETFRNALHWLARKAGFDPARNLSTEVAVCLGQYLDEALREGWERHEWPEWTLTEERYFNEGLFSTGYATTMGYVVGDVAYDATAEAYYVCGVATNSTSIPSVNTADWDTLEDSEVLFIPLDQPRRQSTTAAQNKTLIGTMLSITDSDPRLYASRKWDFAIGNEGLIVPQGYGSDTAWLRYRKRPQRASAEVYAASTAYVAGDVVYYASTGHCYVAKQASTGNLPTNTTYWTAQEFPYVLAPFCRSRAYGHWLSEDGQPDKAAEEFDRAEGLLADEWAKADTQQQQHNTFRVLCR